MSYPPLADVRKTLRVDWYRSPIGKLYEEIADDMPEPRTLIGAWREMRMVWRKQKENPDYQFDTPLPATARNVRSDTPDEIELESSIGDLAPEGLR